MRCEVAVRIGEQQRVAAQLVLQPIVGEPDLVLGGLGSTPIETWMVPRVVADLHSGIKPVSQLIAAYRSHKIIARGGSLRGKALHKRSPFAVGHGLQMGHEFAVGPLPTTEVHRSSLQRHLDDRPPVGCARLDQTRADEQRGNNPASLEFRQSGSDNIASTIVEGDPHWAWRKPTSAPERCDHFSAAHRRVAVTDVVELTAEGRRVGHIVVCDNSQRPTGDRQSDSLDQRVTQNRLQHGQESSDATLVRVPRSCYRQRGIVFAPKEILQNALMGLRPVSRLAQRRHQTGVQQDVEKARLVLNRFVQQIESPLGDCEILELGPGKGTGLMRLAGPVVKSYAAFDVEPYLSEADLTDLRVDYRVDGSGRLPWEPGSFDIVWSHSVLEHVRKPGELLREVHRVLRPEGLHIASIDLQDHYGDRNDSGEMYGFFRYGERLWWTMTSNRSSYCNRLRASEWRSLLADKGFRIEDEELVAPSVTLDAFREHRFLDAVADDDLLTAAVLFVTVAT